MAAGTVAGVYAAALLDLARERGVVERVVAHCRGISEAFTPEVVAQLDNPRVGKAQAKQTVRGFLAGAEREVVDLILLLIDRNRLGDTRAILREAIAQHEASAGMAHVTVTSATALDDAARASLDGRLRPLLGVGPAADIAWKVDAALVGGLTIRLGDTFIDGSVRRRLDELKSTILNAPVPSDIWS
jgi:F-type H+-transporting ATPase subunit delta